MIQPVQLEMNVSLVRYTIWHSCTLIITTVVLNPKLDLLSFGNLVTEKNYFCPKKYKTSKLKYNDLNSGYY